MIEPSDELIGLPGVVEVVNQLTEPVLHLFDFLVQLLLEFVLSLLYLDDLNTRLLRTFVADSLRRRPTLALPVVGLVHVAHHRHYILLAVRGLRAVGERVRRR